MSAAALKTDASQVVGKKELAAALGWSRPTLDRRLEADAKFPIRKRGDRSGGWEFCIATVRAYLAGETAPAPAEAQPAAEVVSITPRTEHQGEVTARQRRDGLQADLMADRLRKQRGELVEADAMRMAMTAAIGKLAQSLNALPDVLVRRLGLPETAGPVIRQELENARRSMVAEIREMLAADEALTAAPAQSDAPDA